MDTVFLPGGELYNQPCKDGIAEDYISARGLLKHYEQLTLKQVEGVKELAMLAIEWEDEFALKVFEDFGFHIAACLSCWISSFKPACLVLGGNISKASSLFLPAIEKALKELGISLSVKISTKMELSAIAGAVNILRQRYKLRSIGG
jgi:glucokinase